MTSEAVSRGETGALRFDSPESVAAITRIKSRYPDACPERLIGDVDPARIPRHVAVIMDGNGRWAQERGFPRIFGHRNGAAAVRTAIETCAKLGIDVLTLYSFSSENWSRPSEEVQALMSLCVDYCDGQREALRDHNVRVRVIGRRDGMPDDVVRALETLEQETAGCTGLTLCLAINYGSRDEIVDAVRSIAERVLAGALDPDSIDADLVSDSLYTRELPDPDMLIRTGGDLRVSNYLLWQISYSEIYVTRTYWPEFDEGCWCEAVREFARRQRRFGGLIDDEASSDDSSEV